MGGNRSGFTLLEVMVALLLLSTALAAMFQNMSASTKLSVQAMLQRESVRIAQNLFADHDLTVRAVRNGEAQGDVPDEPGWEYKLVVTPLYFEKGDEFERRIKIPNMGKMELVVFYKKSAGEREFRYVKWIKTG